MVYLVVNNEEFDEAQRLNKLAELEHDDLVDFERMQEQINRVVDSFFERFYGEQQ